MTVSAASLIDPHGDIDASMFPSDDAALLLARVAQYIARAEPIVTAAAPVTVAVGDQAVALYVYYLANDAVYRRLSSQPLTVAMSDQGSRQRSQAQIDSFRDRAERYRLAFNELLPTSTAAALLDPPRVITSVPNRYRW